MADGAAAVAPASFFSRMKLPFIGRKTAGDDEQGPQIDSTGLHKKFSFGKARWIGLVLLIAFMGVRHWDPGPLNTIRLKTFDFYQQIKPREIWPESPVVIIDLDEASLSEVGQWPWPRNQVAQLVQNAFALGNAVLGFDVIFAEPDRMNGSSVVNSLVGLDEDVKQKLLKLPSNDEIFASVVKRSRRVVAGQAVLPFPKEYPDRKPLNSRIGEKADRGAPPPRNWATSVPGLLRNVEPLEKAAAGHGLLALEPEPDGIVRRVPAMFRHGTKLYPALSIEMMRLAAGRPSVLAQSNLAGIYAFTLSRPQRLTVSREILKDDKIGFEPYDPNFNRLIYAEVVDNGQVKHLLHRAKLAGNKKYRLGRARGPVDYSKFVMLRLPALVPETDRSGKMYPYFSKTDKAKYVSAKDVLAGTADPAKMRGKLAIVGTSAVGLLDIKTVPTEQFIPGVEVHAQLIESVMTNQFLTRPNFADVGEMAIALVAGMIIIILVPWVGAKWTLLFFLVTAVGAGASSWYMFAEHKVLLDAFYGVTAVFIIYVVLTYLGYASEEAQRRQTREAFGKYLSPAMVEQVVENPALLTLGGAKRDMTLLFCDVRGFTSISELFDAEGLTVLINKLLTPLTDIILERNGTIDKYMGDCIMAFWNAPLDDSKHAEDGCRAALEMVAAMAPLNARLEQEAKEEGRKHLDLKVGLGLNSGDAVVGNMGTSQRMDYSVLGDTVNTAARLEGQSKTYGVDIVIGPNTYAQVQDFAVIDLDCIQVKGKTVGLDIYALMGDEVIAVHPAFIKIKETVAEMLQVYRSQNWEKAKELINKIREVSEAAADTEIGPALAVKAASSERFSLEVLCELYEGRIKQYELEPPPADWDGVFIATSK